MKKRRNQPNVDEPGAAVGVGVEKPELRQTNLKQTGAASATAAPDSNWITDELPDDEMTVLMRLKDDEFPVWPGFRDDGVWNSCDGSTVQGPVLGWMHLEYAAHCLDRPRTKGRK
jgi:hypothetical protein